jgi:hypothetical protein
MQHLGVKIKLQICIELHNHHESLFIIKDERSDVRLKIEQPLECFWASINYSAFLIFKKSLIQKLVQFIQLYPNYIN